MPEARTALVPVDPRILSSYDANGRWGGERAALVPLVERRSQTGRMVAGAAAALLALHEAIEAVGGDFRVTEAHRDQKTQAFYRARYERWLRDGSPTGDAFDPRIHKRDAVSRPGRSFHGAGLAIDAWATFPGVVPEKQLDRLWELARPLGWRPIIRAPWEGVSESWHFDWMGPWTPVFRRVGYEQTAIAANLDAGVFDAFGPEGVWRHVQGQLHRAGYDCGDIDGIVGRRTMGALRASGFAGDVTAEATVAHCHGLPDRPLAIWPVPEPFTPPV